MHKHSLVYTCLCICQTHTHTHTAHKIKSQFSAVPRIIKSHFFVTCKYINISNRELRNSFLSLPDIFFESFAVRGRHTTWMLQFLDAVERGCEGGYIILQPDTIWTWVQSACIVPTREMKVGGVGVAASVPRLEAAQGRTTYSPQMCVIVSL